MRTRTTVIAALTLAACNSESQSDMSASNMAEATAAASPGSASNEPRIACDVIPGLRASRADCDDLRALKDDVKVGAAALDVESPMWRGHPAQVLLRIDRRPLEEIRAIDAATDGGPSRPTDLNATDVAVEDPGPIANESGGSAAAPGDEGPKATDDSYAQPTPSAVVSKLPGEDHSFASETGRVMTASLSGQGFDVRLISPETARQQVPSGGGAEWIWEVVPQREGTRSLVVHTEAIGIVDGQEVSLGTGGTSETVTVQVRTADRVRDWLEGAPGWLKLIAGILGAATTVMIAWWGFRRAFKGTGAAAADGSHP